MTLHGHSVMHSLVNMTLIFFRNPKLMRLKGASLIGTSVSGITTGIEVKLSNEKALDSSPMLIIRRCERRIVGETAHI
jgi:hypothetical protein